MKRENVRKGASLALGFLLTVALASDAVAQKKDGETKKEQRSPGISVLDSTEAQWGRRSINDSVYRGYTVNAVYLERGRQRLPDSFRMYRPTPIDENSIVGSGEKQAPMTIKVNGQDQPIPQE